MLEPIHVINEAAAMVGAAPLQSVDAETFTASAAYLAYDRILGHILGIYRFSFSLSTRELSQFSGAEPFTGYKFIYALPPDRVGAPISFSDDVKDPRRHFTSWLLEGNTVHSNASPLFARIRFKPHPSLWSGTFREAFTTALASNFALTLKRNRALAAELKADAYGPPSMADRGGKVLAAIHDDSQSTPSLDHPALTADPLTDTWRS